MIACILLSLGFAVQQPDSGFVTTPDGVKLYYETVGAGAPVVIVPGGFLVAHDFSQLAHGHTLVFYDMRNRGRSSHVEDTTLISIQHDVADLETIRRHVRAERVSLIGFSYLGYMVMLYTMAHPDRVDRVVQLGPVPWHFDATYPDSLTAALHPPHPAPADTLKLHAWADSGYEMSRPREYCTVAWAVDRVGLVGDPANIPKLGSGWCDMANEWPINTDRHFKYHIATIAKLTTSASQIAAIRAPVLTIHGTWDRNAPYGSGREWAQTLPHARLVTVPGAAHFSWLDAPDIVLPAIDRFLTEPLHQQIVDIAKDAKGTVYVACSLPGTRLDCDLNEHGHPPMQSTFKFPLAMAVLHQIEIGKLQLDQPVRFLKSDRSVTYSPLQEEFPDADVDVPLRKLIELSVKTSDNTATDIELRLIGGPAVLQHYLDSLGFTAIHQQDNEHTLHLDQKLQYRNYAEPAAMVALLRLLSDHSPLDSEHTTLLNTWMLQATSGPNRIKGLLPAGTPVAHKTGSSFEEFGMIPATNDVGLITLPDGRRLALAIFVIDAHADQATCEAVIARIAQAIYGSAVAQAR